MWKGGLEREDRSLSGPLKLQTLGITLMRLAGGTRKQILYSDFMQSLFTKEMTELKKECYSKATHGK